MPIPFRSRPRDPRAAALAVVLSAFLLTGGPAESQAQVILNTERFQVEEMSGFHLVGSLSISGQRGNTDLLDLSTSGIVGIATVRHWTRVIFGGRYLSDDDRSILDQQYLQLRYSYLFSPETRSFHFVQAQKNETLLLQSRWLVGSGVRRTLVRTDRLQVAGGTGLMAEWERLDPTRLEPDDASRRDALRIANLAVASWDFAGGARLVNILYVQPDVRDLSDLRILNDLGISAPLNERVSTSFSLEWRRDTRPPGALDRDDLVLRMGLSVEVR